LVPPLPQKRSRRASRGRRFALDRRRALIVGGAVAVVLGLSAVIGSAVTSSSRSSATLAQGRARELAKGPIVFLPRSGNECRQKVIDNDTWRIRDNGTVDCDATLGNRIDAPPREGAPSRIDAIRKGFRNN
jgi:hypothetical protein